MTDTSRINELNAALREKVAQNQEIADAVQVVDGAMQIDTAHREAFQANMANIKEIKGLLDDLSVMEEASANSVAAEYAAKGAGEYERSYEDEYSSIGEAFINSPEFKSLDGGANGLTMPTAFETKEVYSGLPSGTPANFGAIQREDIVRWQGRRTTRVRDLFPVRRTNAAVIEYFRQTGFTNNASTVPEWDPSVFGLKPKSSMSFVGEQAPVRTIAHWEAAHRNVLGDEPQLRSIIDNELLYGLRLEEDDQILNGSGTGEDLTGLLSAGAISAGVQEYSQSSGPSTAPVGDNTADAIRRAMTLAYLSYFEPTGVVVHPADWENMELIKDSQGQYLMTMNIASGATPRVWNIPVIATQAIAEGTALVGAFGTGAQLYDRETASIRVAEQHSDFFVRNAVVVLAEQRMALAIKRPEAFVKVTLDGPQTVA
jgi:HK97 family phage major capsid protein